MFMSSEEPNSVYEMALPVKKSVVNEGRAFGVFSEKASIVVTGGVAIFALSAFATLQLPFWPFGCVFLIIGILSGCLVLSIAWWIGFKAPNHVPDTLEDFERCGFGGHRFFLGHYRHSDPAMGRKLNDLLKADDAR